MQVNKERGCTKEGEEEAAPHPPWPKLMLGVNHILAGHELGSSPSLPGALLPPQMRLWGHCSLPQSPGAPSSPLTAHTSPGREVGMPNKANIPIYCPCHSLQCFSWWRRSSTAPVHEAFPAVGGSCPPLPRERTFLPLHSIPKWEITKKQRANEE